MTHLVRRLLDLFASDDGADAGIGVVENRLARPAAPVANSKPPEPQLVDFLAQSPSAGKAPDLITGSIRLLELGDDNRTGVPPQLQSIARKEIEKGLGASDFRHAGDDGRFVFCFSDSNLDRAQEKTALISDRIRTRIADEAPGMAHRFAVQPAVARLDRRVIVGSDLPPLEALIASMTRYAPNSANICISIG
jgi:hypothetical protein